MKHIDDLLAGGGVVLLGVNFVDPSGAGRFEAWAYRGNPCCRSCCCEAPVAFGVGQGSQSALRALESHLAALAHTSAISTGQSPCCPSFMALRRIHDLLYYDGDNGSYDPDKPWCADTFEAIAAVVAERLDRPCKLTPATPEPAEGSRGAIHIPIRQHDGQGSCRSWRCCRCGAVQKVTYEQLALGPAPMCTSCNLVMELI